MIRFQCPNCFSAYRVSEDKAGKRTRCPACREPIVIPKPDVLSPDAIPSITNDSPVPPEPSPAAVTPTTARTCPACSRTFRVPDDKAGKHTKCPECQEQFVVPASDQMWWRDREVQQPATVATETRPPNSASTRRGIRRRYVVAALSVVLLGVPSVGVVWKAGHEKEKRLAAERERVAAHDWEMAQERARVDELQRLLQQQKEEQKRVQEEQARNREADLRREAARESEAAIAKMRESVAQIRRLDEQARGGVEAADKRCMVAFALVGTDPRDKSDKNVVLFYEKRDALIAKNTEELNKKLGELRMFLSAALSDPRYPKDVKPEFDAKVTPEVAAVRALIDQPYPNALAWRERAANEVAAARAQIRKERTELSKRAQTALNKYSQGLEDFDDDIPSKFSVKECFDRLMCCQMYLQKKKLTKQGAEKCIEPLLDTPLQEMYARTIAAIVQLGKEYRWNNDPDEVSLGETFAEVCKLLGYDPRKVPDKFK